ncbi:TetR family transcriptional regulator [Herbihabitans rhizosphaerae]|uniref:TetR family transcriptional regulator n=1 Tax=Herbihabitans rhizosphaerae TaxID=1872711 RepID=A0A4Q7L801_9PSEU|nr:TetR/AcrR family transcriptional regulator [Herbihabitans rhizosphaerae]RZS44502.1 TetR family transcriptional regulator [Herbihabitans rhizosphaerae]
MSPSSARDRFVSEASRLFSTKGYRATSVADIQVACGLTPGSGALYKHFPSKRALLEAVIDTHIETMRAGARSYVDEVPADLEGALRLGVRAVWGGMERDREVIRVMLRDLDDAPDVLAKIWGEVRQSVYGAFTAWLVAAAEQGLVRVADPEATAAVLLASLTYHPILSALIGHTPGDLDADRFADAWVAHALATLAPS